MAQWTLSVPGKTFLAGEYLALVGGASLVLTTEPKFLLKANLLEKSQVTGCPFHSESPAGIFYRKHEVYFAKFALEFVDPYEGMGGFGASSAQFVLLHGLWQLRDSASFEAQHHFDWHQMLLDYRSCHQGPGLAPSGADVVAQAVGGLVYFQRHDGQLQSMKWPFATEILLFHTGNKVSTHEHLKSLTSISEEQLKMDLTQDLAPAVVNLRSAIQEVDLQKFIDSLDQFTQKLAVRNWILPKTIESVKNIKTHSAILAAKGCGALGADVIMVMVDPQHKNEVIQFAQKLNLRLITGSQQISSGFEIHYQPNENEMGGVYDG